MCWHSNFTGIQEIDLEDLDKNYDRVLKIIPQFSDEFLDTLLFYIVKNARQDPLVQIRTIPPPTDDREAHKPGEYRPLCYLPHEAINQVFDQENFMILNDKTLVSCMSGHLCSFCVAGSIWSAAALIADLLSPMDRLRRMPGQRSIRSARHPVNINIQSTNVLPNHSPMLIWATERLIQIRSISHISFW